MSKLRVNSAKGRRFAWFCQSHRIRTTKTESRNCRASVSDAAAFHRNALQFRCHSSFVLRHFRLSHKRNSKGFDQLNRPTAISSHDEILQIENPPRTHNRIWTECDGVGANDDQRRRRDVSVSDLLEVVRRIRKGRSLRAIQLSIDRFRRRAKTNTRANSRFRRFGWADERRKFVKSAGKNPPSSDCGRRGRHDLQPSRQSRLETRWRDDRRHFSRQNQEMERSKDRRIEPRSKVTGKRNRRRASLRW